MAQLKDTVIDGTLKTTSNITLGHNLCGIHPETGNDTQILSLSQYGNTVVGYDGYANKNGNSHIYGNDIVHYVGAVNDNYRPYYRAGDTVNVLVRTAGFCVSNGAWVRFIVPLEKPVIGKPTVAATSDKGFILCQNGKYTHDTNSTTYADPSSYAPILRNGYVEITATMPTTTDATTSDSIGIVWSGILTFS